MKRPDLPSIFGILLLAALLNGCFEPESGTRYKASPDAPTNVTALPGNGQMTLSWNYDTASGGRFLVVYVPVSGGKPQADCSSGEYASSPCEAGCLTTGLSCIVGGLKNGQPYLFIVKTQVPYGVDSGYAYASVTAVPDTVSP